MKDIQPKEYWINVYDNKKYGSSNWPTRYDAKIATKGSKEILNIKTLYRIHVRIKNAETRGIGSGKARV